MMFVHIRLLQVQMFYVENCSGTQEKKWHEKSDIKGQRFEMMKSLNSPEHIEWIHLDRLQHQKTT